VPVVLPSQPAPAAGAQDPQLSSAVRLVRRRRRWGWTIAAGFIGFLIVISVYSSQYNDAADTGPAPVLAVAMVLAAVTVAAIVMVVAASVQLRRRAAGQQAQAITIADRIVARRSGRLDWAIAAGLLIAALAAAVIFLPGLVNGVSYLAGGHRATFVPQSYAVSCSYHGQGDCAIVTAGVLRTASGDVQSTWPDRVPLGRPFTVREPAWRWGVGTGLLDGDGIAVGAAAVSLLFDGFAVLAAGNLIRVLRRRFQARA
jgi:uncharacterized membrane protein